MNINNIRLNNLTNIINQNFGGNWKKLAEAIDKSPQYIHAIKVGERSFSEKMARHIEEKLKLTHLTLDLEHLPDDDEDDLVAIPIYAGELSAGSGCEVWNYSQVGKYHLNKYELMQEGWNPEKMCIFRVKGDSMEHEIQTGQRVLVDMNTKDIIDGRVYAFSIDNDVFIKYLYKDIISKQIIVRSENKNHPEFKVNPEDMNIIGRVVLLLARKI